MIRDLRDRGLNCQNLGDMGSAIRWEIGEKPQLRSVSTSSCLTSRHPQLVATTLSQGGIERDWELYPMGDRGETATVGRSWRCDVNYIRCGLSSGRCDGGREEVIGPELIISDGRSGRNRNTSLGRTGLSTNYIRWEIGEKPQPVLAPCGLARYYIRWEIGEKPQPVLAQGEYLADYIRWEIGEKPQHIIVTVQTP